MSLPLKIMKGTWRLLDNPEITESFYTIIESFYRIIESFYRIIECKSNIRYCPSEFDQFADVRTEAQGVKMP